MTVVVTIASGKAEVGKSIISANLSQYLTQNGHRTGLMVAGARQPVWGIEPDSRWPDILGGRLPADKTIHRDVFGIDLMIAQNCDSTLQGLCTRDGSRMDNDLDMLDAYAYLIVDCAAQISAPTLACCLAATATMLILTPDSAALTAAYEWLAHLARHDFRGTVHIVLNQVGNPTLARSIYLRFRDQVHNRLRLQTNFWGSLNKEPTIDPQVVRRYPLSQTMPQSELLRNIRAIGDRLVAEQPPENPARPLKAFWRSFLEYLRKLPADPETPDQKLPSVFEGLPPMKNSRRPAMENAQALAGLNTQLTNIANDLQAIRRLLEAGSAPGAAPGLEQSAAPSHKETLDFDAFIGRHQKPEEP
jgi:MinD-like ATPase involved in chromosome partitioning or flagellar assembly